MSGQASSIPSRHFLQSGKGMSKGHILLTKLTNRLRRWGRATIDIISCQQIIQSAWFYQQCREHIDKSNRDKLVKRVNWFHTPPPWVECSGLVPGAEYSWAMALPPIYFSSMVTIQDVRGSTPLGDTPPSGTLESAWEVDEEDCEDYAGEYFSTCHS